MLKAAGFLLTAKVTSFSKLGPDFADCLVWNWRNQLFFYVGNVNIVKQDQ